MSLLHCACSKNHITDSPPHKPHSQHAASAVRETPVQVTINRDSSSMEVFSVQFERSAAAYSLHTVIGRGHKGVAVIHLACHKASSTPVAIKRINLDRWDQEFSYIQREIVLTQQLLHENILTHYCSFIHDHELWTIMPPMGYGSCKDLIQAYFTAGLPEIAVHYILRDVTRALEYLHDRAIIHRGVKGSHVMISGNGEVKLTGLHNAYSMVECGQCLRTVYSYPQHAVDCLLWFSPEILQQNLAGYDCKSDMYSLGILACELVNGQAPFSDMPVTQMLLEKINGTKPMLADSTTCGEFIIDDNCMEEVDEDGRKKTPEEKADGIFFQRTFSPHLHSLVSQCLEKNPAQRPSSSQLLDYPLFKFLGKRSTDVLPTALHPVPPLTNLATVPKDNSDMEEMARHMSEVSMQEDWVF